MTRCIYKAPLPEHRTGDPELHRRRQELARRFAELSALPMEQREALLAELDEEYNRLLERGSEDGNDGWAECSALCDTRNAALEELAGRPREGLRRLIGALLTGGENRVAAPVNLYCALLTLSRLCGGETRQELLRALDCPDGEVDAVQQALRRAACAQTRAAHSTLSGSLWLGEGAPLRMDALREVCERHGMDAAQGPMGTAGMDAALRDWVRAHTGGQLDPHLRTEPDTVLELLTAARLRVDWFDEFEPEETRPGVFYPEGKPGVVCDFMRCRKELTCCWGRNFTAVRKNLQMGYAVWFVLPDARTPLREVAADPDLQALLACPAARKSQQCMVRLTVPKFDLTDEVDLCAALQTLGIRRAFEPGADFSPISPDPQVYLSKARHAARLKLDEHGIEAASYVEMGLACAGLPPHLREVEMMLDRPFLFAVTSADKLPLYVGAMREPECAGG